MRLRNIRGAKEKVNASNYIVSDPLNYKGNYNSLFKNNNPIHVEIGMGKGQFIIEMAKKNPNINFIGIEKYNSILLRAVEKLDNLNLLNLKLINEDVISIDSFFEKEIEIIYLNFSDPWPKKRHRNRRLTSHIYLEKYEKIFINNSHILMKTDNRKLFEFSLKSLIDFGYKISNISLDLYDDKEVNNVQTEYEEKFQSQGYNIYKVEILKK